jgi:hypothetical protein
MRLLGDVFGQQGILLLGIYGDIGDNYHSFNVRMGSGFRF